MESGIHMTNVFARTLIVAGLLQMCSLQASAEVPVYQASMLATFDTFDARQGIAVDDRYFYAVNNTRITKHDKQTGKPLLQWDGGPEDGGGLLIHLDSATVHDGKLYAAHSNYPFWPMTSSVEIWDTATMEHIGSHSFPANPGSFTWIDYHDGFWWGAFGNYDKVQDGQDHPYGTTAATTLVKMDTNFVVLQQWLFPSALQERFTPMSNSGGSWGPDGYLYITGHDHPEVHVVQVPAHGSEVQWLATVQIPQIEGQGIAWDRSSDQLVLWGILKAGRKAFSFSMPVMDRVAQVRKAVIRSSDFINQ